MCQSLLLNVYSNAFIFSFTCLILLCHTLLNMTEKEKISSFFNQKTTFRFPSRNIRMSEVHSGDFWKSMDH